MKNMVLLLDTNVLLNYVTKREDKYKDESLELMRLCISGKFDGYMAFHSISTMWYILIKMKPADEVRFWLSRLCEVVCVIGADHQQVLSAIKNANFSDLEDCLQDECAVKARADYIVTCNISDFRSSKVPAVTPAEVLEILKENEQ